MKEFDDESFTCFVQPVTRNCICMHKKPVKAGKWGYYIATVQNIKQDKLIDKLNKNSFLEMPFTHIICHL